MRKHHTHVRFGLYNVQPDPHGDMVFFYFTPCLCIAVFEDCDQGGVYIGWLFLLLFIPFAACGDKQWEFYMLPMISWARMNNRSALYLCWLFWKLVIPLNNKEDDL